MGKWVFCGEYGDGKKVYRCSECRSTITVDSELIGKMNGEKFCYNCGERMNAENDKKEDFRKLTDELIRETTKAKNRAKQYKRYADDLDRVNKTLVERLVKLEREKEREQNGFDTYLKLKAEKDKARIIELTTILDHYGSKAQSRQAVEELSELIQAICKCERMNYTFGECEDDPANLEESMSAYKNLLGEIADVIVMIEQLKIMVGERDRTRIENIIDEKINRQLERIKAESEGLQ
jgi:hypothetical protein